VGRTIGIEIEMIGLGPRLIADVVNARLRGTLEEVINPSDPEQCERMWEVTAGESIWTVVDDDSLDAPVSERGELVTPPLLESDLPLVSAVVDDLRGAGATVSASCGLHIHIGIPGAEVGHLNRLIEIVEQWEPAILAQMLPSRLQFAGPLDPSFMAGFHAGRPTTLDELWTLWYGDPGWRSRRDRYDEVRYRGLNLHSFRRLGTVEFRYFNGTLDPKQILDHVRSCLRVVEDAGFPEPEEET
jgi:Putative amidoligase enzyme